MTAKKTKTDTPVVSPLLDAYGNPGLVAPGQLIESAWGNAVVAGVQMRFPDAAAMRTTSAARGTLALTVDGGVVWIMDGGVWKPTALGNRVAFRGLGPPGGQSVPASALTTTVWSQFTDPYDVFDGQIFTVPTGWDGRWSFEWAVEFAVGGSVGARLAYCAIPGGRIGEQNSMALEGGTRMTGAGSVVLAAGQTTGIVMYHTDTTGALICNSSTNQYFTGYYTGPY